MLFKRRCKITFISHGSTIYAEENRLSDNESYPPLNDKGKEEAEKIARWISKRSPRVDKIYTSSALRCLQTASVIAKSYQKEFEIIDDLCGKKAGVWSGMSFSQIEEKFPDLLKRYHEDTENYWPEGGESLKELRKRVDVFTEKIIQSNLTKRIIVVTHPDIIRAAIASAMDIPIKNQNKIIVLTGSASQVNYYKSWSSLVYAGHIPLVMV